MILFVLQRQTTFTKKIEKKDIRITEITINRAEFVKEISNPPRFNSKYLEISNWCIGSAGNDPAE